MFIAFGQKNGNVQAVALVLVELAYLVAVAYLRPWMDKKTNIFNISICTINFLNVIFLLVFTNMANAPDIVVGVMGVIFFVMNAAFALVLLILVLVASIYALLSKNPDVRYQPMRDDRGSFIKSHSQRILSTELDALGATARGDLKARDLDDDRDSFMAPSINRPGYDASQVPLPPSTANSNRAPSHLDMPHSPVDPTAPYLPSGGHDGSRSPYGQSNYNNGMPLLSAGGMARTPSRGSNRSPAPSDYGQPPPSRGGNEGGDNGAYLTRSNTWQRGVGYE